MTTQSEAIRDRRCLACELRKFAESRSEIAMGSGFGSDGIRLVEAFHATYLARHTDHIKECMYDRRDDSSRKHGDA